MTKITCKKNLDVKTSNIFFSRFSLGRFLSHFGQIWDRNFEKFAEKKLNK